MLPASHLQNDLANVVRTLHPRMGRGGFGQRKRLIHHRRYALHPEQRPDGLPKILRNPRLGRVALRSQRAAGQAQPSHHQLGEVDFYLRPLEERDLNQAPILCEGLEIARNVISTYQIKDQIGPSLRADH